jgi:hypothetical protein
VIREHMRFHLYQEAGQLGCPRERGNGSPRQRRAAAAEPTSGDYAHKRINTVTRITLLQNKEA